MRGLLARLMGRKKDGEVNKSPTADRMSANQETSGRDSSAPPITVVSGLPRSGTSLMMRMLEAGGIPVLVDNLRTADTDNPNGYYELERVKKLPEGDTAWLADGEGKVVKVISFLLKSLPDAHNYRIVFMERDLPEVLASQKKMLTHRQEATDDLGDDEAAELFTAHLHQVRGWLAEQPNMETYFVNYGAMVKEPSANVVALNEFCGGALDIDAMMAVVDPALYRNRS